MIDEEEGTLEEEEDEDGSGVGKKKKDKKLVFLSRSVLEKIKERPMTTGTQIANEILELYKRFSAVSLRLKSFISLESGLQKCVA